MRCSSRAESFSACARIAAIWVIQLAQPLLHAAQPALASSVAVRASTRSFWIAVLRSRKVFGQRLEQQPAYERGQQRQS